MVQPIRTVVAAMATLDTSDPVLAPAMELARVTGAVLHLVHVYDLPDPIQNSYIRQMMVEPRVLGRYSEELRSRLESLVRDRPGGESVVCHVVSGSVGEGVCRIAETVEADLLLVGATRRSRIWRRFLGTSAESVIRQSSVPVLVIRQSLERPVNRVLLTTDLSRQSEDAHQRAIPLVRSLFRTADPAFRSLLVIRYEAPVPLPLRRDLLRDVARRELGSFLGRVEPPPVSIEPSIRLGEPANEILAEAAEWAADLVVVGTHGRSGASRLLLGSVAGATLREAGCNVLVVPAARVPLQASPSADGDVGDERGLPEASSEGGLTRFAQFGRELSSRRAPASTWHHFQPGGDPLHSPLPQTGTRGEPWQ